MKVKFDATAIDAVQAKLRGLADKKIKVATISALNTAARAGHDDVRKSMTSVFDRPTRWTLGAVAYWKSGSAGALVRQPGVFDMYGAPQSSPLSADRLFAVVDVSKESNKQGVAPQNWISPNVFGGARKNKRHEIALQRAGILPAGMYIVPGAAAKIDAYGNMSAGQINQILAWFKAFAEAGHKANMNDKGRARLGRDNKRTGASGFQYICLKRPVKGRPAGIYQRYTFAVGSAIKPVMIFIKPPTYSKRLDFHGVARKAAIAEFKRAFPLYLGQMIKERNL